MSGIVDVSKGIHILSTSKIRNNNSMVNLLRPPRFTGYIMFIPHIKMVAVNVLETHTKTFV